jgi:hypothetical protein
MGAASFRSGFQSAGSKLKITLLYFITHFEKAKIMGSITSKEFNIVVFLDFVDPSTFQT